MTPQQKARKAAKFKIWAAKNRERRNQYQRKLKEKWSPEKKERVKEIQKGHYDRLQQRREIGLCAYSVNCDSPSAGESKFCLFHWCKCVRQADIRQKPDYSIEDLLGLWMDQNGRCAISGMEITPGSNAELDHIIPVVRGGPSSIANLRFIHRAINRFKWDLTDGEFKELLQKMCPALLTWSNKEVDGISLIT